MQFTDLNLSAPVQQALRELDYTQPTPIQQQAIQPGLQGKDVLGIAQTGTGKTAAFLIPLLERLNKLPKARPNHPQAVILAPTRELAIQIAESAQQYGKHLNISHTIIHGGVSQKPQVRDLRNGAQIVVATPGRLLDLMQQGHVKTTDVQFFVLDEADRMLDMGFLPPVKKITKNMPRDKQTFFFSATMNPGVDKLAKQLFNNPIKIQVAPQNTTAEHVDQKVLFVDKHDKKQLLLELLKLDSTETVLVFTRTKRNADRVSKYLNKKGHNAVRMHGNRSQNQRKKALDKFSRGHANILVATDVAARGIDVDEITHVINYELPDDTENYVHRIGRTGRAGNKGTAVSLCAAHERSLLREIEGIIDQKIPHLTHKYHSENARQATGKHARRKSRRR